MGYPMDSTRCVLAAVDLTADSPAVVSAAAAISKIRDRRLHLIHVIDHRLIRRLAELREWPLTEAKREAQSRARQSLARLLREADAPPDSPLHLSIGDPTLRIRAWVQRLRPVLLVLGEPGLLGPAAPMEPVSTHDALGSATQVLLVSDGFRDGALAAAAGGAAPASWSGTRQGREEQSPRALRPWAVDRRYQATSPV